MRVTEDSCPYNVVGDIGVYAVSCLSIRQSIKCQQPITRSAVQGSLPKGDELDPWPACNEPGGHPSRMKVGSHTLGTGIAMQLVQ